MKQVWYDCKYSPIVFCFTTDPIVWGKVGSWKSYVVYPQPTPIKYVALLGYN